MLKVIFFLVLLVAAITTGAFAEDFEIMGIISEKQPYAVINNTIVKVGDEVDGELVTKILDKSVFLRYKG